MAPRKKRLTPEQKAQVLATAIRRRRNDPSLTLKTLAPLVGVSHFTLTTWFNQDPDQRAVWDSLPRPTRWGVRETGSDHVDNPVSKPRKRPKTVCRYREASSLEKAVESILGPPEGKLTFRQWWHWFCDQVPV